MTKRYADDHELTVCSPLTVQMPTGKTLELAVEGIVDPPKGGSPFGDISVSMGTFAESFADQANVLTLLNLEGGPSDESTAALEKSLAAFPAAKVETREGVQRLADGANLAGAQDPLCPLGLSTSSTLFGVINTLVLSVFERTRELGILRAIGMTRRQVRRMIGYEPVVTALIGATLGIVVGIFLAVVTTIAVSQYGIVFAVPYGTLVVFVCVAILAGMLAAILPARRASKLNVLEALQYE